MAVPNNATITRLINRFRESGSIADRMRSGRPAILIETKLADMDRRERCCGRLQKSYRHCQLKQAFRTKVLNKQ
ncbi:hypothetical protein PR048_013596 [Dryococelus australis]|uniref:Uncharacterized protein n=1 Tax=Dryococelus australis TaxID=614101 RepID=A0ABQ9HSS0_9NEOP|nr:hypothetical protein PR048_013596 [Dryococelus australis]